MQNRREFLRKIAVASTVFVLPTFGVEAEWKKDWLEAFRSVGFDPAAVNNNVFVACGDVHHPDYSQHLEEQIGVWNTMRPSPRFVVILGDNGCNVSRYFGHTPDEKGLARARQQLEGLRAKLSKLNKAIPLKLVIGNHDTMPGEIDAVFFRSLFPEVNPYETFEDSGIRFMIWNGGHDGSIDVRQRTWIQKQAAMFPKDGTAVIFVHQPALGMIERERGIPAMVRKTFADHIGSLWLIGGHVHVNRTSVFSLRSTKIVQITQPMSVKGYWIYGMCNGRIVARVFSNVGQGFRVEALPDLTIPARPIPVPFEGRDDVLWSLLIGDDPVATEKAFVSGKGGNCGTWWFYVDELIYRLPLANKAAGARFFAILAGLSNNGSGEPPHIFASKDGIDWIETPLLETKVDVNRFAIPEKMCNSEELFVKVKSYGLGANTCVGGFALCR